MFPSSHQNLPTIPSPFSPETCECIHMEVVGSLGSKIRFCCDLRIDRAGACHLRSMVPFIEHLMIFPIDCATLPIGHVALSIGDGTFLIVHAALPSRLVKRLKSPFHNLEIRN